MPVLLSISAHSAAKKESRLPLPIGLIDDCICAAEWGEKRRRFPSGGVKEPMPEGIEGIGEAPEGISGVACFLCWPALSPLLRLLSNSGDANIPRNTSLVGDIISFPSFVVLVTYSLAAALSLSRSLESTSLRTHAMSS